MSEGRENRFGGLKTQLAERTETLKDTTRLRERFGKSREQDNTQSKLQTELTRSEMYKVLIDPDLEPKEKAEKIAALLTFNKEDLESNPQSIAENKAIITQLMTDFKNFNVQLMELIRDNPLSELGLDIDKVFAKYHDLVNGRSDLDEKLGQIDKALEDHGGFEGLVKALHSAKDKQIERDQMQAGLTASTGVVDGITGDIRGIDATIATLTATIAENESDTFLFFKGAKKAEIAEQRKRLEQAKIDREVKTIELTDKKGILQNDVAAYQSFLSDNDFQLHERILEILDVGSEGFKEQIRQLAQLTIDYIGDTDNILSGSKEQIALLLERGLKVLTMIQNTGEQSSILLEGLTIAQGRNGGILSELEHTKEGLSGIEALKHQKVSTALNQHITDTSSSVKSAALISQELGKTETSQVAFVGRLQEGLADAEEQHLVSVGSASMTGVATLSRVESFAAAIPGLIAKGQYAQDSRYALGELHKEFERALSAKMAGNSSITGFTDTLREIRESMQDRNDLDMQIATERKSLIDNMIAETDRLAKANESALSIEATVNKELYGTPASAATGGGGGGVPKGAVLRMVM